MVNEFVLLAILIIHWVADFILQSDANAKGKSSSWIHLLSHTFIYSLVWIPCVLVYLHYTSEISPLLRIFETLAFVVITFISHTITDYITSREVKKLFAKNDHHNGFILIGFDQMLHYVQLFLTLKLIGII